MFFVHVRCKNAMRFALLSELSILVLTVVPAVLFLPHNVSILRLPSMSVATKPVIPVTNLLGDWPPVPWTFTQEAYEIRFDQNGRKEDELDNSRRPEIVAGIKGVREYFLHRSIWTKSKPIYLDAGIINFSIGFTGRQSWTGHGVLLLLHPWRSSMPTRHGHWSK